MLSELKLYTFNGLLNSVHSQNHFFPIRSIKFRKMWNGLMLMFNVMQNLYEVCIDFPLDWVCLGEAPALRRHPLLVAPLWNEPISCVHSSLYTGHRGKPVICKPRGSQFFFQQFKTSFQILCSQRFFRREESQGS